MKPLIVIFDNEEGEIQSPLRFGEEKRPFTAGWKRSICRSIDYPAFKEKKAVKIPDDLAEEWPDFPDLCVTKTRLCGRKEHGFCWKFRMHQKAWKCL